MDDKKKGWVLLALGGFVLLVAAGQSMSLATDLGYADDRVEAVCEAGACQRLVERLEAEGFPRATSQDVETYALQVNGEVRQAITVDWARNDAVVHATLEDASAATVVFTLSDGAYWRLVDTLKAVRDDGEVKEGNYLTAAVIFAQTQVDVQGTPAIAYKWDLSLWMANVR